MKYFYVESLWGGGVLVIFSPNDILKKCSGQTDITKKVKTFWSPVLASKIWAPIGHPSPQKITPGWEQPIFLRVISSNVNFKHRVEAFPSQYNYNGII